jgi:hypothetical protein
MQVNVKKVEEAFVFFFVLIRLLADGSERNMTDDQLTIFVLNNQKDFLD